MFSARSRTAVAPQQGHLVATCAIKSPRLFTLVPPVYSSLALLGRLSLSNKVWMRQRFMRYRNGLFAGHGFPRAVVSFSAKKTKEEHPVITAAHIRILLPRPLKVEPGQYINLWMPSVSLSSWMQTHPFTVVSWSRDRQDTIELLLQPRDGLSADLVGYAPAAKESSISFLALFTGPHGVV
jgi:hypothetical protein